MAWTVQVRKKVVRQVKLLPKNIQKILFTLLAEIEIAGPVRGNWPNYGLLGKNRHHCHLKKGRPCYVAVWEVADKEIRLIEVIYVGTHENAPY